MMSTRPEGGGGERELPFLSAHRCPEVDWLPHHAATTQNPPSYRLAPTATNQTAAGPEEEFFKPEQEKVPGDGGEEERIDSEQKIELDPRVPSEADYLDVYSSCRSSTRPSEEEEDEKAEEEEGSISDWSEEDLSLHFSPSVILPSEEESDTESGFECIDITMENQVRGHDSEVLKMVPKRQIQLRRRSSEENSNPASQEKPEVILEDGPRAGGGVKSEASVNELHCALLRHRPEILLRQHSMPASFHQRSATYAEGDSNRVYKGLVAGASQGFHGAVGGNCTTRQRLQKSFSLDETKTKMASCIITSVLSKKMQVEQSVFTASEQHKNSKNCTHNTQNSHLTSSSTKCLQGIAQLSLKEKKPPVRPSLAQQGEPERGAEAGRGELGVLSCKANSSGVFKAMAPVHVVRDMRSLVKNTYSLSFRNNGTATHDGIDQNVTNSAATYKVIGQEGSPPPSYQQAVGVKGRDQTAVTRKGSQTSHCTALSTGHVAKVTTALHQSLKRRECSGLSYPITQTNEVKMSNQMRPVAVLDPPTKPSVTGEISEPSQSKTGGGFNSQSETSYLSPALVSCQAPPDSSHVLAQGTQPPSSSQSQSTILSFTPPSAPAPNQPLLPSYLYTPSALAAYPTALQPHLGKVGYIQGSVSYIQNLQQPTATLHLLRRTQSEEKPSRATGTTSCLPEGYKGLIKYSPPHNNNSSTAGSSNANTQTSATQEQQQRQQQEQQQQPQQQFMQSLQGFLPTKAGSEFLVDMAAVAPGSLFSGHTPCRWIMDPESGRCFYVDTPPQPQTKMLFDPETGRYIEVFFPTANPAPTVLPVGCTNPAPSTTMLPVGCTNPAPTVLPVSCTNPAPTMLTVLPYQPGLAVPAVFAPPCLPFTLQTQPVDLKHTAP